MFKRYPQLQSGYIAPTEKTVALPPTAPVTPASALLNRVPVRTQQDLFFDPKVDEIVNDIVERPFVLRSFKFQQEMFCTFAKAFGGGSFTNFITLQAENPELSQVHVDFLEETLDVICGLIPRRSVSLDTWATLISAANPSRGGFKPQELLGGTKYAAVKNLPLDEFMVAWIRSAGYTDMILSMRVLFGRRTLHAIQGGSL